VQGSVLNKYILTKAYWGCVTCRLCL